MLPSRCWIAACILSLLSLRSFADQANQVEHLKSEHQQVLDQLNTTGEKGGPLKLDDKKVPGLLKRGWTLAGQWAAAYLNNNPGPTPKQLKEMFVGFAPKPEGVKSQYGDFLEYHVYCFEGSVVRVAPTVYVAQARYWKDSSTGTFFVLARDGGGQFHASWSIKDIADDHYPEGDEIGRWAHLTRRAYYNGPLDVETILPLAKASNGHPRFLVDAYQSADGGTALAQLSAWEWTGTEAKPLLIKIYQYAWDYRSFHLKGNTLQIGTKEETQAFFSCGMCPEPKGIWTLRFTPDGVNDLGHKFLHPELQWTDELLSKINKGTDVTDIAHPGVVKAIRSAMQEIQLGRQPSAESEKDHLFYWGMFGGFRRINPGAFQLSFDDAKMTFNYILRNGKPFFTKVVIAGG